jgi:hypothetical protein
VVAHFTDLRFDFELHNATHFQLRMIRIRPYKSFLLRTSGILVGPPDAKANTNSFFHIQRG